MYLKLPSDVFRIRWKWHFILTGNKNNVFRFHSHSQLNRCTECIQCRMKKDIFSVQVFEALSKLTVPWVIFLVCQMLATHCNCNVINELITETNWHALICTHNIYHTTGALSSQLELDCVSVEPYKGVCVLGWFVATYYPTLEMKSGIIQTTTELICPCTLPRELLYNPICMAFNASIN